MREVKQSSTGAGKGFPKPKYVSEVICNWFTEDAYLHCIVYTSCLALLVDQQGTASDLSCYL